MSAIQDEAALLTDFLDGELSPEAREAVLRRLEREPDLAAALAAAQAGRALLTGLPPVPVPLDFERKARRRLTRKRAFRARPMFMERFGAEVFAIVAVVAIFAVYLFLTLDELP